MGEAFRRKSPRRGASSAELDENYFYDAKTFAREPPANELPASFSPLFHSFAFESNKRQNLHYLDEVNKILMAMHWELTVEGKDCVLSCKAIFASPDYFPDKVAKKYEVDVINMVPPGTEGSGRPGLLVYEYTYLFDCHGEGAMIACRPGAPP